MVATTDRYDHQARHRKAGVFGDIEKELRIGHR
jgi:hypothetical protein